MSTKKPTKQQVMNDTVVLLDKFYSTLTPLPIEVQRLVNDHFWELFDDVPAAPLKVEE